MEIDDFGGPFSPKIDFWHPGLCKSHNLEKGGIPVWKHNVHSQCTEYNVQCTDPMYRVQSTMYNVQSTMYNVQCKEFSGGRSAMYRVQSIEYKVQSTKYRVRSTMYRLQSRNTKNKVQSKHTNANAVQGYRVR